MKRIAQRIRESYWLRSGAFTFLQRFSIALFGFASFVILVRLLDVDDFGVWVLYVSFSSVIELVREGFVKNPLIRRFISTDPEEHPFIISASLLINIGLFVLLAILLMAFARPISSWMNAPSMEILLYLYIPNAFLHTFFLHFTVLQEAHLNFKATFWAYFAQKFIFLFYLLLFVFILSASPFISLSALAVVQVIATAVGVCIALYHTPKYSILRPRFHKTHFKAILNHGKYSFGTNMSSMLLNNIDSWMLGSMISPIAVAIYNPALRITRLVEIPMSSIAAVTYPKLVQKEGESSLSNAKYLYEKSVSAILATMLPIVFGVILFSYPIVELIAGQGYENAAPVLQVVMLYGLIAPFNRQFGNTLDAIGKAHLTFYFVLSSALLNTFLNYVMIRQYGIIGAATATIVTHFIGFILRQYFLSQFLSISFWEIVKQTFGWYQFGANKVVSFYNKA